MRGPACLCRGWLLRRGLRLGTARLEGTTARSRARGRLWAEGRSTLLGRGLPWPTRLTGTVHGLRGRSRSTHLARMVHGLLLWRRHGSGVSWPSHGSCTAHGLLLWRRGKTAVWLGRRWCSMGTHGRRATWARWWWGRPAPVFTWSSVLVGPHVLSVSFVVIPVAAPIFPAAIHDHVGGLDVDVSGRRVLPVPGHPVPLVAAPVPVATNPVVVRARRHGDVLLLGRRRRAWDEDRRLLLDDHRGLGLVDGLGLVFGLGRRLLVVDRLWLRRRWSDGHGSANHAA